MFDFHTGGDLRVELVRGDVASVLAWERPEGSGEAGYSKWKFTTLRHWGERADAGPFTLRVADFREGSGSRHPADNVDNDAGSHDGTLVSWTLKLYGHADPTSPPSAAPSPAPSTPPEPEAADVPEAADEQPESSTSSADERADPPAEADQTADAASTKSPAATLALALASAAALALAY